MGQNMMVARKVAKAERRSATTVQAFSGMEVAQIAGEAGFIGGVAGVMVGITLVGLAIGFVILRVESLVEEGKISAKDAATFRQYVGFAGANATFSSYVHCKLDDKIPRDEGFDVTSRILEALSLHRITVDTKSAQPYDEQFWDQFDVIMELSEEGLKRELPAYQGDALQAQPHFAREHAL